MAYTKLPQAIDAFESRRNKCNGTTVGAFWPVVLPFYGMSKLVQASPRLSDAEEQARKEQLAKVSVRNWRKKTSC